MTNWCYWKEDIDCSPLLKNFRIRQSLACAVLHPNECHSTIRLATWGSAFGNVGIGSSGREFLVDQKNFGPANWCKHYPVANGQRQSPVDLKKGDVLFDPKLKGANLDFHYLPQDCHELWNKGHTWSINVNQEGHSYLNASHLPWEYKLMDIHCHWGRDSKYGSEHTVNGRAYSGEIHIVHVNKKYSSFEEALRHGDGLAVLGIFLEESDHDNKALDTLVNSIKSIEYKNDKVLLPKGFDIKGLIPDDLNFWTYDGSLTTPPCCECVIWTIFRTPIKISKAQIQVFRHLCQVCKNEAQNLCCLGSENGQKIVNNYRPTQPIRGRRIRSSFE